MEIEKFLIESIIDIYAEYCKFNDGISDEAFDKLAMKKDGTFVSDYFFFQKYYEDILTEPILEELYIYISNDQIDEITLTRFVSFLASRYFVYNYNDGQNSLVNYLKKSSIQEIENLFVENYNFGMDMVKSAFFSIVYSDRYQQNRKKIYSQEDYKVLVSFEKQFYGDEISKVPRKLKTIIYDLYDYYISLGCFKEVALNNVWEFFLHDFDPFNTFCNIDSMTKDVLKSYMFSLILADVFEDLCNDSTNINNQNDRNNLVSILISILSDRIVIPSDKKIRNDILEHFIATQFDSDKKVSNRINSYKENGINVLKKVNPCYLLDELTF